jgi:GH25 family lysozyme M1 (1,4-beta-N-acetylmuramidase)
MRASFTIAAAVAAGIAFLLVPTLRARASGRDVGPDVSHYQGATGISQDSWNQIYAEGKRFAFIKATEGLTGPDDAAMTNNVLRATAAGLLPGVYHYCHPENRPTTNGAVQEADHFLAYANTAIGPGALRPALDVEGSSANLSTSALTDWIVAFSNRVKEQRGAGAAPIIYMSRSFAAAEVDNRLANYDLWLAYPTNVDATMVDPPPTSSYPKPTGVFNNWAFWQYSWTGTSGGISPMDLDACHNDFRPLSYYIIPTPSSQFILAALALGPGGFQFQFTNTPGTHFTVLKTTDSSLPLNNWNILGAATETSPGAFQFSDTNAAASDRAFYRVRSP